MEEQTQKKKWLGQGRASRAPDSQVVPRAFPPMTALGERTEFNMKHFKVTLPTFSLACRGQCHRRTGLDHNVLFKIPPRDCCDDWVRKFLEMRVEKMFSFTLARVRDTVTITQVVPGRLSTTFVFKRLYILKISLISGLFSHWPLPVCSVIWMKPLWGLAPSGKSSFLFENVDHHTECKVGERLRKFNGSLGSFPNSWGFIQHAPLPFFQFILS